MAKTEIRVIYGDTDQMGVVYYGNYLRFFEAARSDFLREKGARWRDVEARMASICRSSKPRSTTSGPPSTMTCWSSRPRWPSWGARPCVSSTGCRAVTTCWPRATPCTLAVDRQGDIREFPAALSERLRP